MKHSLMEVNRLAHKKQVNKEQVRDAASDKKSLLQQVKLDCPKRREVLHDQLDSTSNALSPRKRVSDNRADSNFLMNLCNSLKNSEDKVLESPIRLPNKLLQSRNFNTVGKALSSQTLPPMSTERSQFNSNPCLWSYQSPLKSSRRRSTLLQKTKTANLKPPSYPASRNRSSCCILPISELPECG